jgi:hypothetical protein
VWSQEGQWAPLWEDIERLAGRLLSHEFYAPHFLGAVVIQQQTTEMGMLPLRTIIDGQQRLTTLQILLDAIHEQTLLLGYEALAAQLRDLVENASHFCSEPNDRFKVWPTNRDRAAFNEVMSEMPPIKYVQLANSKSRLIQAHQFFSEQAIRWLQDGRDDSENDARAQALVQTVTMCLQLVVIQLQGDEDAQEIFETLNARGTPLTAADLIKNFVFQRLDANPDEAEKAYEKYWEDFETPFWEKEVSSGRVNYSRSSLFMNQWLIAETAKDVPAREVFVQFKRHVIDSGENISSLLGRILGVANLYRAFTESAAIPDGNLDRLALFIYRTATLESEVIKPIVIWLFNPELEKIASEQTSKALQSIESWLIRRAFVRGSTKAYNHLRVDLLQRLMKSERAVAGDIIEGILREQESPNLYWPGDAQVRHELSTLAIYKTFRRSRTRMVLEAIEDHRRGFDGKRPLSLQRVKRGTATIEHVMPQEWDANWPSVLTDSERDAREQIIHTLGNLSLMTQALNSKISNGPWASKKSALADHEPLLLTQDLLKIGIDGWTESTIQRRTSELIDVILTIWPVPPGHEGRITGSAATTKATTTVADLVSAGLLTTGQTLYARVKANQGATCVVGSDGRLYVGDIACDTPSGAARLVAGNASFNGWWFWVVDLATMTSLKDLWQEFHGDGGDDESDDS